MAIVSVDDVRNAAPRFAQGVADELIDVFIEEEEDYIGRQLNLDALPSDNLLIFNIARDLVISKVAFAMQRHTSNELELAEAMRREALRRLREVESEGLLSNVVPPADELVHNELEAPMWVPEDFWLES